MSLSFGLQKHKSDRAVSGNFLNDLFYGSGKNVEFSNLNEYILPGITIIILGLYILRKK